jgi:hypothetical protein
VAPRSAAGRRAVTAVAALAVALLTAACDIARPVTSPNLDAVPGAPGTAFDGATGGRANDLGTGGRAPR